MLDVEAVKNRMNIFGEFHSVIHRLTRHPWLVYGERQWITHGERREKA